MEILFCPKNPSFFASLGVNIECLGRRRRLLPPWPQTNTSMPPNIYQQLLIWIYCCILFLWYFLEWLGGRLENMILMKPRSSAWTWTLDLNLGVVNTTWNLTYTRTMYSRSIAKLSPGPNSSFSWGLSWLYFQLKQPATHPPKTRASTFQAYNDLDLKGKVVSLNG